MTTDLNREGLEAAQLAVRNVDGCGLTIDGERVFCDDPRAGEDRHCACVCKDGAEAAIRAYLPFHTLATDTAALVEALPRYEIGMDESLNGDPFPVMALFRQGNWLKRDDVLAALATVPAKSAESDGGNDERCPVCAEAFKADDLCATDIELGTCHAACLEGSPTVDLNTGEKVDGPIPTYRYDELAAPRVASGEMKGRQGWIVGNEAMNEGVVFLDEADAKSTAKRRFRFEYSALGERFAQIYDDDSLTIQAVALPDRPTSEGEA